MRSEKKIDIVFAADENYLQHFCVALTSLLESNICYVGKIFLINDVLNKRKLTRVTSFIKKKYNKEIVSLSIDDSVIENFRIDKYISKAAYYRLFLGELLPSDVDKVLYLDSDIIINGNLAELVAVDFRLNNSFEEHNLGINGIQPNESDELYLYAVDEISWQEKYRLKELGLESAKYFNSGILVINIKKWRKEKIVKKLIDIAITYKDKLLYWDQDVFNIAFEHKWGDLDSKFNANNLELVETLNDISKYSIIHYTEYSKPWHFKNKHPFKNLYWKFLRKTPFWYYIPNDMTVKNFLNIRVIPYIKEIMPNPFKNRVKRFIACLK